LAAPGEDGVLADGRVTGEEGADAGALAADAGQGAGVGHGVGAAAAVLDRHRHAEDVVLAGQRQYLVVEAVFDVAQLLDGADFLAERLDVVEQFLLVGRGHVPGLRGVGEGSNAVILPAPRGPGQADCRGAGFQPASSAMAGWKPAPRVSAPSS